MKTNRALVTGATGHIGSTLCRALLERGLEVIALVRESSDRSPLAGLDLDVACGDVLDAGGLADAARGCDVVFHAAAIFEVHERHRDEMHRVAVEGAHNAVRAAKRANARLVFTGSVSAVGFAREPGTLLDERSWATDLHVPYYRAKLESERIALDAASEVDVVTVLPTLVLGPGDHRVTPSSRMFVDMLTGSGATVDGGANVIDVRDVAWGMVSAAERGRRGERYILGGENVLVRDLGDAATRLSGRPVPHLDLPRWAFSGIAMGMELASSITGRAPSMTRAAVRDVLGRYAWYDTTRARTELGLVPRPLHETLTDAARFFEARGIVALRKEAA